MKFPNPLSTIGHSIPYYYSSKVYHVQPIAKPCGSKTTPCRANFLEPSLSQNFMLGQLQQGFSKTVKV